MKKILVTGGAGYKGTLLVSELLERGLDVTILDNFAYGYEPALAFSSQKNCHLHKKDIRNIEKKDVADFDVIYHLAGISGYPACEANPHSAQTINVDSTQKLVKLLDPEQVLVYASTTSMYGRSDKVIDESYVPKPVSLYGITKYKAEQICMEHPSGIALRFATLFGASLKMRCDLLVNDFVYRATTDRSLVLFDSASIRTFLHVKDAIQSYLMVLEQSSKMIGKVFNVGSNSMNYSKKEIGCMIKEYVKDLVLIESELEDPDRRNFIINFDKINALGFNHTLSLNEGIEELIRLYAWYKPFIPYKTI